MNGERINVGGTASIDALLPRAWQVASADFLGCLRDLRLDGSALDLASPLAQRGTGPGCDRDTETCSSSGGGDNPVCGSGGVCVDEWWSHWCQCPEGKVGSNCDEGETRTLQRTSGRTAAAARVMEAQGSCHLGKACGRASTICL